MKKVSTVAIIIVVIYLYGLILNFPIWISLLISEFVIMFYWYFTSKAWAMFAKQGPWNILPTIVITFLVIVIGLPITFLGGVIQLFFSKKYSYIIGNVSFAVLGYLLGCRLEKVGELPDGNEAKINVSNHSSFLDTILSVLAMYGSPWTIVAARKMFYIPPFCFYLWKHAIPLDRGNKASIIKTEEFIIDALHKGISILIFSEGKRRYMPKENPLGEFKLGAFKYALLAQKQIVPITFSWPKLFNRRFWLCPQKIKCIYGIPVEPVGSKEEICAKTWAQINQTLKNNMPEWV